MMTKISYFTPSLNTANMSKEGFDPSRSGIKEDRLTEWLAMPITPDLDLQKIPGIGPAAVTKLAEANVHCPMQLLGKFMQFKGPDVDTQEVCDTMWYWLKDVGINSNRTSIVEACATKVNLWCPGTYDGSVFDM
jgi:hypothetical protein